MMNPLLQPKNEESTLEVKQRQLDCVMNVLEGSSNTLSNEIWENLINITQQIGKDEKSTERLVEYAFFGVSKVGKEFLDVLPFKCLKMYLNTIVIYGKQSKALHISLSAIGLLWNVSDQIRIRCKHHGEDNTQQIWLLLFDCLGELCVDSRPSVRKNACDTLLQTVASHSDDLTLHSWQILLSDTLFSLLEKVRVFTKNASNDDKSSSDSSSPRSSFLRDTPAKQWSETTVQTLFGVVRIFNAHRSALKSQTNFYENWSRMIGYIEHTAIINNSEISLAALKDFYEFHFGRTSEQKSPKMLMRRVKFNVSNRSDRTQTFSESTQASCSETQEISDITQTDREFGFGSSNCHGNTVLASLRMIDFPPLLSDIYWIVSWKSWLKIGKTLSSAKVINSNEDRFLPEPIHWVTYLQIFPSLFARIKDFNDGKKDLGSNELLGIFRKIAAAPQSSPEQQKALKTNNPELTPTHEAVIECLRILAKEMSRKETKHAEVLPDLFSLLADFSKYSLKAPQSDFRVAAAKKSSQIRPEALVPFAELSSKFILEFYPKVASLDEEFNGIMLLNIIRGISDPLIIRYNCLSHSIWINAASTFLTISKIGLPIARSNMDKFKAFWMEFIKIIEKFLFAKNPKHKKPLRSDEMKRFEFVDCQFIELLRTQILPYAAYLPMEFMQAVINVLEKASTLNLNSNDAFALDLCEQRLDLCKVSFEALLSLSQIPTEFLDRTKNEQTLGVYAISSLFNRCKQVIDGYAHDEQRNGPLELLTPRINEICSTLHAISTLIEGLATTSRSKYALESLLYNKLVEIYPTIVQMVPSCKSSAQVQVAVMNTLNAYQTLLNLKK